MKILFIRPPTKEIYKDLKGSAPEYPPLGLAYVAAVLEKEGHEIRIIDLAVESINHIDLIRIIKTFGPEVIGLTAVTPNIEIAYSIIDKLRNRFKNITFLIGGPHVTSMPEEALEHADIVVRSEGEYTALEIIKSLENKKSLKNVDGISFKKNKKIIHNKSRKLIDNLDELPYPARHLLPMKKYQYLSGKGTRITNIMMSRGCPFRCNYCNKNIFGSNIRGRSIENILGEIDELVKKFNIDEIHVSDDTFNYDREKTVELFREIIKRRYGLKFFPHNGVRVNSVDEAQLDTLKKAGFYAIAFGVESGNQQIINNIRKGITLDQARKAFLMAKKVKFDEVIGYFMLGLKGENESTANDTINFSIELNPTIAKFHIVVPYPGTDFYNELKAENRLRIKKWSDFGLYSEPTFIPKDISLVKLLELYKKAYLKFYLRFDPITGIIMSMIKNPNKIKAYVLAGINILKMSGKGEKNSTTSSAE